MITTAQYQRGALKLWWCITLFAVVTLVGMVFLISTHSEHNFFADGWSYLQSSDAGQAVDHVRAKALALAKGQDTGVSKCIVKGGAIYSNVDCKKDNPTSQEVELHDSKGFGGPVKVPPKPLPDVRQKIILESAPE